MKKLLFAFLLISSLAGLAYAQTGSNGPTRTVPYEGYLQHDGTPLEGDVSLEFYIVAQKGQLRASALWTEPRNTVPVRAGRFAVQLGNINPLPSTLFEKPELYVGVVINGTNDLGGAQKLAASAYAIQAMNGVPLGTIITWWRADASTPLPDGYKVCDGSVIGEEKSPLHNQTVPNLVGAFVRGTEPGDGERETGGGTTSKRRLTSSSVSAHTHQWSSFTAGKDWFSYNSAGSTTLVQDWDNGIDNDGSGVYPFSVGGGTRKYYTSKSGAHSHSVELTGADVLPAYVGLLQLMRIW